jgi:hypothetical protein
VVVAAVAAVLAVVQVAAAAQEDQTDAHLPFGCLRGTASRAPCLPLSCPLKGGHAPYHFFCFFHLVGGEGAGRFFHYTML